MRGARHTASRHGGSASIRHLPPSPIRTLRRRAFETVALRLTGGDQLTPPARLHVVGDSDFRETGDEFLRLFRELVDLQAGESVLDVGCGIGRIARALAGYISPDGSYEGFDVAEVAVRWCQRHYRSAHPNFGFTYVDVENGSYKPEGTAPAEDFSFPYADGSFDFAFLTSVFTHMMPAEVQRYSTELRRVLRPGGRCLATFFLMNDESRGLIAEGKGTQPFLHDDPPCSLVDPAAPESAIAYEEPWVLASLADAGLRPRVPPRYGSWCGRERFTSYQDIIVADRVEPHPR
jgi:SAM-dependent methyltransferase